MSASHRFRFALSPRDAFCVFWLALLLGVTAMLAIGGRPDPSGLGQALDGSWRFHAGDDLAWAAPGADDRSWDQITLVSRPEIHDFDVGIPGYLDGWRAHGHPKLEGYGWYRRQVTLPSRGDLVLVGPPAVDDGYEVYWNGHRVGGVGRLTGAPRVSASRPTLIGLPAANGETALLAIRTFMQPGVGRDNKSGGLRTVPVLASRQDGEALYRAQWRRWIAGYVVDAAEPLAMLTLALIAVLAAPGLARPSFARWIALALVASAGVRSGNPIAAWTDLLSLPTLLWLSSVILGPGAVLLWTMAWNEWTDGRDRRPIAVVALSAWAMMVLGALAHVQVLIDLGRGVFAASLAVIAIRIVRRGTHRWLALAAMLSVATGLFAASLSALGVPSIWFPFNIGVSRSQFAYALALPLLALVLFATYQERRPQGN